MTALSLLYSGLRKKTQFGYGDDENKLNGILELDATISEEHSMTAQVTKNEIEYPEDGETNQINDNIVLDPVTLRIEGLISEHPISLIDSVKNIGAGLAGNISGIAGGAAAFLSTELLTSDKNRQQNALDQIIKLRNNKVPFTVVTGLKTYKNMIATQISMPRDSKLGKSLRFSISCQEVKFVKSDVIAIPKTFLKSGVKHSASTKQALGKQATSAADSSVASRGQSILAKVFL